jgi:hypothetical protein
MAIAALNGLTIGDKTLTVSRAKGAMMEGMCSSQLVVSSVFVFINTYGPNSGGGGGFSFSTSGPSALPGEIRYLRAVG